MNVIIRIISKNSDSDQQSSIQKLCNKLDPEVVLIIDDLSG